MVRSLADRTFQLRSAGPCGTRGSTTAWSTCSPGRSCRRRQTTADAYDGIDLWFISRKWWISDEMLSEFRRYFRKCWIFFFFGRRRLKKRSEKTEIARSKRRHRKGGGQAAAKKRSPLRRMWNRGRARSAKVHACGAQLKWEFSANFWFVFANLIEKAAHVTIFWNLARNPEKKSSKIRRKNAKFEFFAIEIHWINEIH